MHFFIIPNAEYVWKFVLKLIVFGTRLSKRAGFLLEVLILTPPALGYLIWLGPDGAFGTPENTLLLIGCGVVTAVPLMLYANGAKGLRLSTIGFLQYIAPTMIFLVAVFVFGEEFDPARQVAFPLIWAALVVYVWSMLRQRHDRVRAT